MFRRATSTGSTIVRTGGTAVDETGPREHGTGRSAGRARHTRRARQREAVDIAALQARVDRVHRRLAEVGSVQVARPHAIDNETARRDPMTRPFVAPGAPVAPRRGGSPSTATLARPA